MAPWTCWSGPDQSGPILISMKHDKQSLKPQPEWCLEGFLQLPYVAICNFSGIKRPTLRVYHVIFHHVSWGKPFFLGCFLFVPIFRYSKNVIVITSQPTPLNVTPPRNKALLKRDFWGNCVGWGAPVDQPWQNHAFEKRTGHPPDGGLWVCEVVVGDTRISPYTQPYSIS